MVTRDQNWGAVSANIRLATFVLRSKNAEPVASATFGSRRDE